MLNQAVDRKRCASCERWRGQRQAGSEAATVAIDSETSTGLCEGGGWDGSERRARSACGHWRLWPALNLPGAEPVR
ncbi:hypothetical protein AT959_13450 [Dechloromonas denitrificans]|uniref:Uncharacterized protein n=1 Tax=Dechloromonas denitrificans TaxID=281362 RepID=A0A133XHC7_9RHOO|nr:hypothetical protein AT959_13450 [Dechloromonas denitrificans]